VYKTLKPYLLLNLEWKSFTVLC